MARGDVVKHRGDHKKSDVMATLITLHARHDKGHWGGGVIGWQGGPGELRGGRVCMCVCVGGGGGLLLYQREADMTGGVHIYNHSWRLSHVTIHALSSYKDRIDHMQGTPTIIFLSHQYQIHS